MVSDLHAKCRAREMDLKATVELLQREIERLMTPEDVAGEARKLKEDNARLVAALEVAVTPVQHLSGCLWLQRKNMPCQCGFNDRINHGMDLIRAAIDGSRSALDERLNEARMEVRDALHAQLAEDERKIAPLQAFANSVLDKPEDRLYHAADKTWWKKGSKGDLRLESADPPELVNQLAAQVERLREEIHATYCDKETGGCIPLCRETPAASLEALKSEVRRKVLEEAANKMAQKGIPGSLWLRDLAAQEKPDA